MASTKTQLLELFSFGCLFVLLKELPLLNIE